MKSVPKVTQKPIGGTSGNASAGNQDRMNSSYLKAVANMDPNNTRTGKVQSTRPKPVKIPKHLGKPILSSDPIVYNELEVKRCFTGLERHLVNSTLCVVHDALHELVTDDDRIFIPTVIATHTCHEARNATMWLLNNEQEVPTYDKLRAVWPVGKLNLKFESYFHELEIAQKTYELSLIATKATEKPYGTRSTEPPPNPFSSGLADEPKRDDEDTESKMASKLKSEDHDDLLPKSTPLGDERRTLLGMEKQPEPVMTPAPAMGLDKSSSDIIRKYTDSYEQTCNETFIFAARTAWGKITNKDFEAMQKEEISYLCTGHVENSIDDDISVDLAMRYKRVIESSDFIPRMISDVAELREQVLKMFSGEEPIGTLHSITAMVDGSPTTPVEETFGLGNTCTNAFGNAFMHCYKQHAQDLTDLNFKWDELVEIITELKDAKVGLFQVLDLMSVKMQRFTAQYRTTIEISKDWPTVQTNWPLGNSPVTELMVFMSLVQKVPSLEPTWGTNVTSAFESMKSKWEITSKNLGSTKPSELAQKNQLRIFLNEASDFEQRFQVGNITGKVRDPPNLSVTPTKRTDEDESTTTSVSEKTVVATKKKKKRKVTNTMNAAMDHSGDSSGSKRGKREKRVPVVIVQENIQVYDINPPGLFLPIYGGRTPHCWACFRGKEKHGYAKYCPLLSQAIIEDNIKLIPKCQREYIKSTHGAPLTIDTLKTYVDRKTLKRMRTKSKDGALPKVKLGTPPTHAQYMKAKSLYQKFLTKQNNRNGSASVASDDSSDEEGEDDGDMSDVTADHSSVALGSEEESEDED